MSLYLFILLAPMFVILFWGVELVIGSFKKEPIKKKLAFFMLCGLFAIISGIAFFLKQFKFYTATYVVVVFFALSQFPSFYIYIYSLTRSTRFSPKIYVHYVIPFVGFLVAVFTHWIWLSPKESYQFTSEYLTGNIIDNYKLHFAFKTDRVYKFTFIFFGIIYYWLVNKRVKEHREKIDNYFSNTETMNLSWISIFNILLLLTLFSGVFFHSVKRTFFVEHPILISIPYGILTLFYWFIGHFGSKQREIYNKLEFSLPEVIEDSLKSIHPNSFENRLIVIMENEKPYLDANITLPDLARLSGTNRSYLSKHINSSYNQNFKQFINEYRLVNAEKLLLNERDMDIMAISIQSGFSSYHTFNRCFKEKHKMSPGTYRKKS